MAKKASESEALLDAAGASLFLLGRLFGRQGLREKLADGERAVELSHILVVQALAAAECEDRQLTVGELARVLGIDPSTASRLVSQAHKAGYLSRQAAQAD